MSSTARPPGLPSPKVSCGSRTGPRIAWCIPRFPAARRLWLSSTEEDQLAGYPTNASTQDHHVVSQSDRAFQETVEWEGQAQFDLVGTGPSKSRACQCYELAGLRLFS